MTARGPRHAKRSSFQEVLTNAEWRSGCGMVAPTPARCVATSMARPSRRPFPPTVPYTVPRQGSFESAINPHLTTASEVLTPGERSSRRFVVARCSNARPSPARPPRVATARRHALPRYSVTPFPRQSASSGTYTRPPSQCAVVTRQLCERFVKEKQLLHSV